MTNSEIEQVGEIHRMPDGAEYRAVIQYDLDGQEPYDDGGWPILRVSAVLYRDYVAEAFNKQAEPYVAKFNELFERIRQLRTWERYAKIFLGANNVHEYGFNRGTDYAYIAFDPTAWRVAMDMDTPEFIEKLGEEKPLSEVIAWIEGDVWGSRVETRYNPDNDKDDEDWETTDDESTWGLYGREWAEKSATESLELAVANHEVVHRYPEHEKLATVQREVDAVLEFLAYGLDKDRDIKESNVYSYWGVDYDIIKQERELMIQRLQEANTKRD